MLPHQSLNSDVDENKAETGTMTKILRFLRHGSNVMYLTDGKGVKCGILSHAKIDNISVDVIAFLNSRLSRYTEEKSQTLSKEVMTFVAAALAIRKEWDNVRNFSQSVIIIRFLEILNRNGIVGYDMLLCAGLLGGGILHSSGSMTKVSPLTCT
jgi:hypothetical protein